MMCPTAAGGGGGRGGGGRDEVGGSASRGRHAPMEWREEERCCCRPLSRLQRAEGMKGWQGEEAGMMDRWTRGRLCCHPILCGSLYRTYRNRVAARRHAGLQSLLSSTPTVSWSVSDNCRASVRTRVSIHSHCQRWMTTQSVSRLKLVKCEAQRQIEKCTDGWTIIKPNNMGKLKKHEKKKETFWNQRLCFNSGEHMQQEMRRFQRQFPVFWWIVRLPFCIDLWPKYQSKIWKIIRLLGEDKWMCSSYWGGHP